MDARLIYGIRDAQGLTTNEKVFLYTVASHNDGMFATHDKNYKAMEISKATYYRVRDALMKKELVTVQRVMDGPTVYRVDKEVLDGWYESQRETQKSHTETGECHTETNESHCAETKVNTKVNSKENVKENTDDFADAQPSTDKKNNSIRDSSTSAAILMGSKKLAPLPIPTKTGPGRASGSPVGRWKERNGIKVIEAEGPEWAQHGYKAPIAVLEKPACPEGGTCGGGELCWC